MWRRIGQSGVIYYTPQFLACYRLHSGSETHNLQKGSEDLKEELLWINTFPSNNNFNKRKAKANILNKSVSIAINLNDQGLLAEAWNRIFITARKGILFPEILVSTLRFIAKAIKDFGSNSFQRLFKW